MLRNDVGFIPLTQGKFAVVDAADFHWLVDFVWTAMRSKNRWYAVRQGARSHVRMHRLIMGEPRMFVDHIDGDGLNNTRKNLRVCTNAENMRNSGKRPSNRSGYKGVLPGPRDGSWMARITVNYENIHLGTFDSPDAAARAYDEAAKNLHGDFARLNFERSA